MSDYSKLIVMLGSPLDGEVLGAARAIGRKLKADGKDWHWFAESFVVVQTPRRSTPPPPKRSEPPAPTSEEAMRMLDELNLRTNSMTFKEARFIRTTRARISLYRTGLHQSDRRTIAYLHSRYA